MILTLSDYTIERDGIILPNRTQGSKPAMEIAVVDALYTKRRFIFDGSTLYLYDKYYQLITMKEFVAKMRVLYRRVQWKFNMHIGKEIYEQLCAMCYVEPTELNNCSHLVPLKDGLFNKDTGLLEENNPDILFTYQFDIDYVENAQLPPIWEYFLNKFIPDGDKLFLFESFLASCFLPTVNSMQKSPILVGSQSSGKTVLCEFLTQLFGHTNVSRSSLHALFQNQFGTTSLKGKLLNIGDDIEAGELKFGSQLKQVLTGPTIHIEPKGVDGYDIRNTAKHLYTCNFLPLISYSGLDDAFYKRWLVIPTGGSVPKEEQDFGLLDKLTAAKNDIANYLLQHSMKGIRDLYQINTIKENKALWLTHGVSTFRFVSDMYEYGIDASGQNSVSEDVYTHFMIYCQEMNYPLVPHSKFGRELSKLGITAKNMYDRVRNDKYWVYIRLYPKPILFQNSGRSPAAIRTVRG